MSLMSNATDAVSTTGLSLPLGYPSDLERDVVLGDGRVVRIRPIVPSDAPELRDAIEQADEMTLTQRFVGRRPELTDEFLRRLTDVDYHHRLALVAFSTFGKGVGIGRYELAFDETEVADVAVAVDPGWRRIGLATRLLALLVDAARGRGVRRLRGHLLTDNVAATALVQRSQWPYGMVSSEGLAEVEIELPEVVDLIDIR